MTSACLKAIVTTSATSRGSLGYGHCTVESILSYSNIIHNQKTSSMLQTTVVGYIGADCEFKSHDGKDFVTFRVSHNDTWTDAAGQQHTNSVWVDCIMNGRPKVADYLKKGTQVICQGTTSLRVYSSQKDRCMKAGMTINVSRIELLGGKSDVVPSRLYDQEGVRHDVTKYFLTDVTSCDLMSQNGVWFTVDDKGFVYPVQTPDESTTTADESKSEVF